MNATSIYLSLLIVLFMILLLHWMRKLKPQTGVSITKDVRVLRIDHGSIKGKLLGMWQTLYRGGVLDFKEMNRCLIRS